MVPLIAAEEARLSLPVARPDRTDRVSFHREILPVLQANCLPCHNQTRAKADLILETPGTMLKGGESGPSLVPGKPQESRVLQSAAHRLEDLVMPPAGNKVNARDLTPEELGLLSLWIEQGAEADAVQADIFNWQTFPTNCVSSFAVALMSDGESVAVARGNRVFLYDAKTGQSSGELADPALDGAAQRDWVSALAFSPDGEVLAAAGFREVRLWVRRPVTVEPAWTAARGTNWLAAAFSSDRSRLATVSAEGGIEVRSVRDGKALGSWRTGAAPPFRLALSEDGRLAVAGADGVLQVISLAGQENPIIHALGGETTAVAWFDQGRQLATVVAPQNIIRTWRLPTTFQSATNLETVGDRNGHSTAIIAIASEPGLGGSFVSADTEGIVRRWFPDPAATPQEIRVEGSIVRLDFLGPGARFAAGLAAGGTTLVSFDESSKIAGNFGGDPRLSKTLAGLEDELALSRSELARAGTLMSEAEAGTKASDETIKKAREKREGHVKALAEKEKELDQQRGVEVAAAKERDEVGAELQRGADTAQAADKALEEARATAKSTAEQDGAAQVAASSAERLKAELERLLATLSEVEGSEAAAKTREAAGTASTEAAARSAQRSEARAKAEQAREELATRAFAAGQKKAEASRAQLELPPRKKQAEERLAAAQKAIKDLQPQVDKARIALEGSTQDVTLAEKSAARAAESLANAKAADEGARKRISATEAQQTQMRSALASAAALRPAGCSGSPVGTALLTVSADGLASRWNLASGAPTATIALGEGSPLAVAGMADHEFIAVYSNAVLRLDTSRAWTLQRTIGGEDAFAAPGPFVDRVNALAFSPDGRLLATGGGEPSRAGELKIWRVSDGELIRDLGGLHSDCVMAIAFSPRGEWLATGGADRFARITPVSEEGPRVNLEGHTHHVLDVAWLADGSTVATAGAEGIVKLWNPKTGERRKNVEGFGKEVTGLKSVGASNQFVAVSGSGQGRVFRADGEKVRDLAAAPVFLQTLSVTRNGSLIAGAGDDGTLYLWDMETGKKRRSPSVFPP